MPSKKNFALIAVLALIAMLAVAQAAARTASVGKDATNDAVGKNATGNGPSLETESAVADYRVAVSKARAANAVDAGPLALDASTPSALAGASKQLDERTEAKRKRKRQRAAAAVPSGPVGGVSQATLDAIAACESGGDPTAVNAGGYYGKYQFDLGTWASVGGTGNPADASEGEQDYRASVLYSRAGSSPWPVCGQ